VLEFCETVTNKFVNEVVVDCYKNKPEVETFLLPTDAHNVKKHRVIKTF